MTGTHIYELPTEVKLGILSELPATKIQSVRRVSKHFRDLIDQPTNRTLLIKSASSALANIYDIHDHVFNFESKEFDLLSLLLRLTPLRGSCGQTIWVIARLWFISVGINLETTTSRLLAQQFQRFNYFVISIKNLVLHNPQMAERNPLGFLTRHFDSRDGWVRHMQSSVTGFRTEWYQDFNFSEKLLDDIYDRAADFKMGSSYTWHRDARNEKLAFVDEDHSRLCKLLDVMEIPDFARNIAFSYAVTSQWAYDTVLAVLQGQTVATDLQLAAIREETLLTLVIERINMWEGVTW